LDVPAPNKLLKTSAAYVNTSNQPKKRETHSTITNQIHPKFKPAHPLTIPLPQGEQASTLTKKAPKAQAIPPLNHPDSYQKELP
jgi:hypothetical protein